MKLTTLLIATSFIATSSYAQLDLPASANNPRATISEEVGITSITIKYSRPDVNKREGKIWGDGNLVTYGFSTQSFITNKNTSPWRAGANDNTTISFEHDVKVEGQPIKAGTYSLLSNFVAFPRECPPCSCCLNTTSVDYHLILRVVSCILSF